MSANPQTDMFQKSSGYWLKRANRCRQGGDLRRAVVLFRHAARLEPTSLEVRMGYASALRELHCYESSNREAFAALAANPCNREPFGLVGRNMLSMGRRTEAIDAFTLYMNGNHYETEGLPLWDEEDDETEEALFGYEPVKRRARFNGLLSIAVRRMTAGNLAGARKAIMRAKKAPYDRPNARRDQVEALFYERIGRPELAEKYARQALRAPHASCQVSASAACLLDRRGKRREAALAIIRATLHVRSASDELVICIALEQMGLVPVALQMLLASLRREPNRLPTCYNLGVCLLKMGDLEGASGYLHLCREIDPDDMQSEYLFARLEEWNEGSEEAFDENVKRVRFYGAISSELAGEILTSVAEALEDGVGAFAQRLMTDDRQYRRFLYALTLPEPSVTQLLPVLSRELPPDFAKMLLRECLLLPCDDTYRKRVAAYELVRLGAEPPYAVWQGEHIACIDPTIAPPAQPGLLQRLAFRRILQAQRYSGVDDVVPYALEMLTHMDRKELYRFAADRSGVWPIALYLGLRTHQGVSMPSLLKYSPPNKKHALMQALQALGVVTANKEENDEAD